MTIIVYLTDHFNKPITEVWPAPEKGSTVTIRPQRRQTWRFTDAIENIGIEF